MLGEHWLLKEYASTVCKYMERFFQFTFCFSLQEFFVVDADNDRVMVCVNHDVKSSHLYVSDVTGLRYTLSLPNIVYISPTAVAGTRLPGM